MDEGVLRSHKGVLVVVIDKLTENICTGSQLNLCRERKQNTAGLVQQYLLGVFQFLQSYFADI